METLVINLPIGAEKFTTRISEYCSAPSIKSIINHIQTIFTPIFTPDGVNV